MVNALLKIAISLFLIVASFSLGAATKYKDFERLLKISEGVEAKLVYKTSGEPVSRPRYLAILVKCSKDIEWRALGRYLMCDLKKYEYDSSTKKLHIEYVDGRVDQSTGESFCDRHGDAEFSFEGVCK